MIITGWGLSGRSFVGCGFLDSKCRICIEMEEGSRPFHMLGISQDFRIPHVGIAETKARAVVRSPQEGITGLRGHEGDSK